MLSLLGYVGVGGLIISYVLGYGIVGPVIMLVYVLWFWYYGENNNI